MMNRIRIIYFLYVHEFSSSGLVVLKETWQLTCLQVPQYTTCQFKICARGLRFRETQHWNGIRVVLSWLWLRLYYLMGMSRLSKVPAVTCMCLLPELCHLSKMKIDSVHNTSHSSRIGSLVPYGPIYRFMSVML